MDGSGALAISIFKEDGQKMLADLVKQSSGFPISVYPQKLQQLLLETEAKLNFPIDYTAASILYASSISIGNSYVVEVKREYVMNCAIYAVLVGRPGINKSHPLSFALKPIFQRDGASHLVYLNEKKEYERQLRMTINERKEQGIVDCQKPIFKKILCSDYTPEALVEIHGFNRRGIGVYADELAGWIKNFGRYNKGSEQEFWLSNFSGKPIIQDRKNGDPVHIKDPFISVFGTIQAGLLQEFAKEGRSKNGFIDRILFVFPDLVKPYFTDDEIDSDIVSFYARVIEKLLALPYSDEQQVLRMSPEAKKAYIDWQRDNTNQCRNIDNESIEGIYSKLETYLPRFALIIQLLRWACDEAHRESIDHLSMNSAIQLVEYFRENALKVNRYLSVSPVERLPENKRTFYETIPMEFATKDALKVAEGLNFERRRVFEFLDDRTLFHKLSHGRYKRLYP